MGFSLTHLCDQRPCSKQFTWKLPICWVGEPSTTYYFRALRTQICPKFFLVPLLIAFLHIYVLSKWQKLCNTYKFLYTKQLLKASLSSRGSVILSILEMWSEAKVLNNIPRWPLFEGHSAQKLLTAGCLQFLLPGMFRKTKELQNSERLTHTQVHEYDSRSFCRNRMFVLTLVLSASGAPEWGT